MNPRQPPNIGMFRLNFLNWQHLLKRKKAKKFVFIIRNFSEIGGVYAFEENVILKRFKICHIFEIMISFRA